ncbi:hypothetical protein DNTS_031727, partial [Danionella cerebrum]
ALVLKTLCANNGSLGYEALADVLGFDEAAMEMLLGSGGICSVSGYLGGRKTVIARIELRLCRAKGCSGCGNLHLCVGFVFGSCRFQNMRMGCRFSHDLFSGQNYAVLEAHGLETLDLKELRLLLLQSDHTLLPQVSSTHSCKKLLEVKLKWKRKE